jgi:hypothetical protein
MAAKKSSYLWRDEDPYMPYIGRSKCGSIAVDRSL